MTRMPLPAHSCTAHSSTRSSPSSRSSLFSKRTTLSVLPIPAKSQLTTYFQKFQFLKLQMACHIIPKNEWNWFKTGFLDDDCTMYFVNLFGCIRIAGNQHEGEAILCLNVHSHGTHSSIARIKIKSIACIQVPHTRRVKPGVLMKEVFVGCFLRVMFFRRHHCLQRQWSTPENG